MLAEQFDVFLFDLDGVIYVGHHPQPYAAESLTRLRNMGKEVRFLTNNPERSRDQLIARLDHMGIFAQKEEMITCGRATALFLQQQKLYTTYVIGTSELAAELQEAGIATEGWDIPQAVVVGGDETVSYRHIQMAMRFISQGARFIATNADTRYPTPDGPAPATGAIVAAIQVSSGKRPLIIGKPFPTMFKEALLGFDEHARVVMIGDNPQTDILGAHQMGLCGILIAHDSEHPPAYPSSHDPRRPDAILTDLSGLFIPHPPLYPHNPLSFSWPEQVAAGVAAVVFNERREVLLVRRGDNGMWGLPSGHVEPGETVEETAVREVLEESGLHIRVTRLIGVYSDPISQVFSYPTGEVTHFITTCFLCEINGGELLWDGKEILHAHFFKPDNLPHPLLPMHPQWLADALEDTERAFIR